MNDDNYITIQGWMRNELNLKGNELIVYALINGFSQDEESEFKGSIGYMAEWLGSTKQTVHNTINSLCEKGLVNKTTYTQNGVKMCTYQIIRPVVKNFDGGSQKIRPNNNNYNNKDILRDKTKEKHKPTVEDVLNDCPEELREVAEAFVDHRKALKSPVTGNALKLAIKKAKKYAKDDLDMTIAIIEQSMERGWKGIFPLDDKTPQKKGRNDWIDEIEYTGDVF